MTGYWESRKTMSYYAEAARLARRQAPAARSAIDVGARDTHVLEMLDWVPAGAKVAIDLQVTPEVAGALNVHGDFLDMARWAPKEFHFDIALCLQVLEHLPDPAAFLKVLFSICEVAIISVPHMWEAGSCEGHLHDPIDAAKLVGWAGRSPYEFGIARDEGVERLVAAFPGDLR